MKLWLFDISGVRFSLSPEELSLTAYSPSAEVLAVLRLEKGLSRSEMALRGYDAILASGRVERVGATGRKNYPIALYDPFTGEVAVGALPKTKAYSDRLPLGIGDEGCAIQMVAGGVAVEKRTLNEVPRTSISVTRAAEAHEERI